jgi:hypothetical protein
MSDEPTNEPSTHPEEMKGTVEFNLGNLATVTATGRTTPAGLIGACRATWKVCRVLRPTISRP